MVDAMRYLLFACGDGDGGECADSPAPLALLPLLPDAGNSCSANMTAVSLRCKYSAILSRSNASGLCSSARQVVCAVRGAENDIQYTAREQATGVGASKKETSCIRE